MVTNNINVNKIKKAVNNLYQTHTPVPDWRRPSWTGYPHLKRSNRKFYMIVAGWAVVLGVAVAATLKHGGQSVKHMANLENAFFTGTTANAKGAEQAIKVELLEPLDNSMPSSFRNRKENLITHPERLIEPARILAEGKRPLRVLQIGDSHVAGKTFPNALKSTLIKYFGKAESPDTGHGIWFSYTGSNGATSKRFMTDRYMDSFAEKHPDLIIVSLGTNEAHGMGYREDIHERNLDSFFETLYGACPGAAIMLTTPPGDYLTRSYVNYRRTSRSNRRVRRVHYSKQPNPMSARCASCIMQYAVEHDMAAWDLFTICGGEEAAQRNWVAAHFMRPDRVHFEHRGYEVQGKLMGEALARTFSEINF